MYNKQQGGGGGGGRGKPPAGRPRRRFGGGRRFSRRKVCRFCVDKTIHVDYKNYRQLRDYITERGKIVPRRISGTCAKHQHMLASAIRRSRIMALISFTHR
jgi:small subunit ribosomal protein S18